MLKRRKEKEKKFGKFLEFFSGATIRTPPRDSVSPVSGIFLLNLGRHMNEVKLLIVHRSITE